MGATDNLKTYEERIVRDKGNCGGEAVFRGTCVTLRTIFASSELIRWQGDLDKSRRGRLRH